MATATEPKPADAPGYVDFDEFIDFQISKTRSGIKATDLLTALIGGAAAVLAYVLIFALFDHWVIDGGFGTGTRIALLSLLVVGLVTWAVWKLVLPYFRNVTPLYAASQIEQSQPELQNSLLTLIDLKRSGRPVPESIETALEKRSALNLSHMDIEEAVDRRALMRLSYVLFALVVLTCGYVLFSPKKLSNSLWRALLPASSVSVATRTRIDNVDPGDVEVLSRAQLTVSADLSGQIPDDVTLLFTTEDRRFVDEPVVMRQTDEGLQRFSGIITGENGAGILQNLTYLVAAGDARSEHYHVTVKQPPSATVQDVRYEYPDYMGLDERTQPGGAIDSWEGTWVNVRAKANMPLKSAMVRFSDNEDTSRQAEEFPAQIENGIDVTARWQLKMRSDGTYPAFYRIECKNEAGETDIAPTLYTLKIRPDLPPRIELAQPTGDMDRPANAVVPLLYAAEDQDFLLRSIVLYLEVNGDTLPQQPRLFQAPPFRKSVHDVHNLELEPLQLIPGDRLTYWLEARDNMEPFADRSGNRANTPKLNITITEPASPEEVQEQLEEDQQQVAEKLEQAREQAGDESLDPQPQQPERGDETDPPPPNEAATEEVCETPQPSDSNDASESVAGQSGGGGEDQQEGSGQGQSPSDPSSSSDSQGDQRDDASGTGESSSEGTGEGSDTRDGEESFDNLLKKLMEREQQRQQDGDDSQPQQAQSPSPSGAPEQRDEGGQQPADPNQIGQPGQSDETSEPQGGENSTGQSASPSGQGGANSAGAAGQSPSTAPESMNDSPSPGQGTDPTSEAPSDASPDGTPSTPGDATGGKPNTADEASPPTADNAPTNDGTAAGGEKRPGDDATGANPGDGNKDPDGVKPETGTANPPEQVGDQTGTEPGEATDNPPSKTGGQPDGPDEPMKGSGDPQGQRADRPQTGEGGNAQQTSQGNKGGDQQGPGDSTGQKGTQESAGQKSGQPGSSKSEDGSSQQSGGDQAGGESTKPGGSPSGGENAGQSASGGESDGSAAGGDSGSESTPPGTDADAQQEMSDDASPEGAGDPSAGEDGTGEPGGTQKGGGQKGGEKSAGESAGNESGGQGGGESGQPGEGAGQGGQAGQGTGETGGPSGSPPADGAPGGTGGGSNSDGGKLGPTSPDGQGGGGQAGDDIDAGRGTGGERDLSSAQPEDVDLDARKKAANLVLERLQDQLQRGEIDPELRDDLNLTPEQLREFTQKLEQRLAETSSEETSPDAQARRRQFEETLRTIDFDSTGTTREGGDGPRQSASGFTGPNRQAPLEYRDKARLYRQRLMRRQSTDR